MSGRAGGREFVCLTDNLSGGWGKYEQKKPPPRQGLQRFYLTFTGDYLLNGYFGIFDNHTILIAVTKVLVGGQDAVDDNRVAHIG